MSTRDLKRRTFLAAAGFGATFAASTAQALDREAAGRIAGAINRRLLEAFGGASIDDGVFAEAAQIVASIQTTSFPARDVPITLYGAINNGVNDNTTAIGRAIEACAAAGGGRVVVPPGRWRTGGIRLLSNVNLYVEAGATLLFSTDPADYLPVVRTRFEGNDVLNFRPLIYAYQAENVAVTGEGTLDGGGGNDNWWAWSGIEEFGYREGVPNENRAISRLRAQAEAGVPVEERVYGEGSGLRPAFIETYACSRVLIEGVTVTNAPFWSLHPLLSEDVVVRGVTVESQGPNNDGCDPESCDRVLIEDCVFDTRDDCIAIKSGRGRDGIVDGTPCQNVVVRRCTMRRGIGGVAIGSETSADVKNVFVEDLTMTDPSIERVFFIKSSTYRGGTVENVHVRNIEAAGTSFSAIHLTYIYLQTNADGPYRPTFRDISIENVDVGGGPSAIRLVGYPGNPISDVTIRDCTFTNITGQGFYRNNVGDITVTNVAIN